MTSMKNENNQKEFWKLLKMISPKKPDSVEIFPGTFRQHFQSILTTNTPSEGIPVDRKREPLDYEITLEEVNGASFILKPGNSTGIDGISNEMISSLLTKYPDIIIKLFNSIVQSSEFIQE